MRVVRRFFREVSPLVLLSMLCLIVLGLLSVFDVVSISLALFLAAAAIVLMVFSLRE